MTFMNEYGLLIAVSLPVLAIVGIQVFLFIAGERDTLLLPGLRSYPSIATGAAAVKEIAKPVAVVETEKVAAKVASSNEEMEELAA